VPATVLTFLVACASAMGFPKAPLSILRALDKACGGDVQCDEDGVLYAAHESNFQEAPVKLYSWDAKAHLSCGAWQTPCTLKPQTIEEQARTWVYLRKVSLDTWGDLRGLAGANDAGVRLTRARESEREDMLFGATWGVNP
jgi:hypothetical protein